MGKVIYSVSKAQLKRIKKCAKYAGLNWEQIAARPGTADEFCEKVEKEIKENDNERI